MAQTFRERREYRQADAIEALMMAPGVAAAYDRLQDAFRVFGRAAGAYVAGRPESDYRRAHARSIALLVMRDAEGIAWRQIDTDGPYSDPAAPDGTLDVPDASIAPDASCSDSEGTGQACPADAPIRDRSDRLHCAWSSCSRLFTPPADGLWRHASIYCPACAERMCRAYPAAYCADCAASTADPAPAPVIAPDGPYSDPDGPDGTLDVPDGPVAPDASCSDSDGPDGPGVSPIRRYGPEWYASVLAGQAADDDGPEQCEECGTWPPVGARMVMVPVMVLQDDGTVTADPMALCRPCARLGGWID